MELVSGVATSFDVGNNVLDGMPGVSEVRDEPGTSAEVLMKVLATSIVDVGVWYDGEEVLLVAKLE